MKILFFPFWMALALAVVFVSQGKAQAIKQTEVNRSTWQFGCGLATSGKDICQIERNVGVQGGQNTALRVLVTREKGVKSTILRFVTPLNVHLPDGAIYMVFPDGLQTSPVRLVYQSCSERGCTALTVVDDDLAAALKTGDQLSVQFVIQNLGRINVDIDLNGFSIVYRRLELATH